MDTYLILRCREVSHTEYSQTKPHLYLLVTK